MAGVEEAKRMTVYDLVREIELFISDNEHSYDVDNRWLAAYLSGARDVARAVRNGRVDGDLRVKVNEFRAAELEKEIESNRTKIAELERDLKKVKAA